MKFVRNKGKDAAGQTPTAPAAPSRAPKMPKQRQSGKGSGGDKSAKAGGKQKFVIFLGDDGAILVYMRGATVVRRLFAASPASDHTSAILELMRGNPAVPIYILADVLDQQYVRHSFPPVSALSVNNLVNRRITRDFQPEDLTGSIRLGREKTGRKEWQYLLIALASTPLLQQWVDLLVEQPNELKGIFLAPVEGQRFIEALHKAVTSEKPVEWQLLVSHHKVSGFRQIVLREGKLVFTRVTQAIDDAVAAVIAGNIEQEIMNTLEYLRRLGFQDNASLEIIVVASPDVGEAIDINRFNAGQSFVLSPLDVADALGLNQAALSADRFGDVVMAAGFARAKKHELKLFTAYGKKLSQLYQARLGVKVAGALLAVALLGSAAMNMMDALESQSGERDLVKQRTPVQAQLQTVRKALDGLNKNVAFKSAVMLTYDAYMKDLHAPVDFIDTLAPLMDPRARIRNFSWSVVGAPMGTASTTSGATPPPPPPPVAPGTTPGVSGPLTMRVDVEMMGQYADMDELAAVTEKFVGNLQKGMPQYEITHTPYAWEGKTETNLEISFDQQQPQVAAITEGSTKITLFFAGPKAAVPGQPTPGAPAAVPPAGMP